MSAPRPANPYNDRATMRRRFGYYFTGLAIGLVILGLFHAGKRFAMQQQPRPPANPHATMPGDPAAVVPNNK